MPVPDRRRKSGEVDLVILARILEKPRVLHDGRLMRTECLALLHPGLERIEWPQCRIDAERERGPLRGGGGVGKDAHPARKALDGVEQQRGPIGPPGRHLGDPADFEARVGDVDAPQRTEIVDKPDEFAQVLVHTPSSPEPLGIMAFSANAGTGSVQERIPLRKIRVNVDATQDIRRRGLW